jgi:hypothetical protein
MTDINGVERGTKFVYHTSDPETPLNKVTIKEAIGRACAEGFPVELTKSDNTRVYGTPKEELLYDQIYGESLIIRLHAGYTKVPLNVLHKIAAYEGDAA